MATFYQTRQDDTFHIHEYAEKIEKESQLTFSKFRQVLNSHTLFHASFVVATIIELFIFTLSIINYKESLAFILTLSGMILTVFSYLILNYYFAGKKIEQLKDLQIQYLQSCKKHIDPNLSEEEIHLAIAKNSFKLSSSIGQRRIYALSLPPFIFFKEIFLKCRFLLHFKDVLIMQELLMKLALDEYIQLLRLEPTDLNVHTSLANLYMNLSQIYEAPEEMKSFISEKVFKNLNLSEKIQDTLTSAIEELKILDDLSPNDPWTHAQLATCFHKLERYEDELSEYEILSNLRAKDKEILLRLGTLYFKLGKTAKALITYEILKKIDAKYAEHLLSHYQSTKLFRTLSAS
jgi:tetratricopeptide (TPR) repeat protein